MSAIKLIGHVDADRRLTATVPPSVAPGQVELLLLSPQAEEDEAGAAWLAGIAREWAAELSDPREDIYTLNDGEPLDESG